MDVDGVLLPETPECNNFSGFISLGKSEFMIRVTNTFMRPGTEGICLNRAGLETDFLLGKLLQPYSDVLARRLQQSQSIEDFLQEIKEFLQGISQDPMNTIAEGPRESYYTTLLDDVAAIGWEHIVEINTNEKGHWNGVHVKLNDSNNRTHIVSFQMCPEYPRIAPTCNVDVPEPLPPLQWSNSTLQHGIDQVRAHLEKFQDFWDVMDDIDKKCCVLEPDRPTRSCKRRRLAIQPSISLQFEVLDPLVPRALVDIVWFGNDVSVRPYRDAMYKNLSKWKATEKLRKNLEKLIEIRFPSPKAAAKEEFAPECGICYTHRLDGHIPDRVCDFSSCARSFHESCLLEWLQSIPTSRKSFGTIFGSCPYCREPISAKWMMNNMN